MIHEEWLRFSSAALANDSYVTDYFFNKGHIDVPLAEDFYAWLTEISKDQSYDALSCILEEVDSRYRSVGDIFEALEEIASELRSGNSLLS